MNPDVLLVISALSFTYFIGYFMGSRKVDKNEILYRSPKR
jgi:hypothetical protein